MYEYLYKLMIENNADLSMCEFLRVDKNGMSLESESQEANEDNENVKVLSGKDTLIEFIKHDWHYVLAWNKLYRSHIFRNIRYPIGRIHEDEFTAHHIFGECRNTAASKKKMYMYTIRDDSIMGNVRKSFNVRRMEGMYLAFMDRYHFLRNIGMNDLAESAIASTHRFMCSMLRQGSYIKHFRKFNQAIIPICERCFCSRGLKMKLRPAKMILEMLRNIIRDIYRTAKKFIMPPK